VFVRTFFVCSLRSLAARSRAVDNTPIAGIVAPEWHDPVRDHTHNYCTRTTPQIWTLWKPLPIRVSRGRIN